METPSFLSEHIETMSRAEIERQQEAQLSVMLNHAYRRSALTRKLWDQAGVSPADVKSLAQFQEKAPFMSKDAVRQFRDEHDDPYGGIRASGPGELKVMGTTSGTTGDPTSVPGGVRGMPDYSYAREMWHMGMRPGDYHANFSHALRSGFRHRVVQELGVTPILLTMSGDRSAAFCEASKRFRPTTVKTLTTGNVMALETHFERTGEDPVDVFSSYKGGVFAGEPLGPRMKAMATSWGLELFEGSALGDICGMTECRAHDGMHAWEDMAFVECLDPVTSEPMADGKPGEMVVTSLLDRNMTLIRYRTDDIVTVDRSPCACGRSHMRLKLHGRKTDQVVVGDVSVMPKDMLAIVQSHDETRAGLFQIIRPRREMDQLQVRIGYDPARLQGPADKLITRLEDHIGEQLGVPVRVELALNADLLKLGPPNKIPRVTKS